MIPIPRSIEQEQLYLPTPSPLPLTLLKDVLFEYKILPLHSRATLSLKIREALSVPQVREILEWEMPAISDIAELCGLNLSGRLRAIRMDGYPGIDSMKKPVVAGLLLKDIILGKIPKEKISWLVDAGNMNTGFALRYYCEKLSLKGFYIMSRLFTSDMIELLQSPIFTVAQAPADNSVGREREFYGYLFKMMSNSSFRKDKHCLWHARYGGEALYPLGGEIAKGLKEVPDYLVVSIGSGATLECMTAIQDYFMQGRKKPKIVVAEHTFSSLFINSHRTKGSDGIPQIIEDSACMNDFTPKFFRQANDNIIPYPILGPHYDETNPFISQSILEKIEYIQQYNNEDWMKTSHFLQSHGLSVGNSSAANIYVATVLANRGYDVLTVVFEPMRSYYKAVP